MRRIPGPGLAASPASIVEEQKSKGADSVVRGYEVQTVTRSNPRAWEIENGWNSGSVGS